MVTEGVRRITRTTPVESLPEYLTPEEFWTYVGIGRASCYELLRRGEIPSMRFGRLIRIPKRALEANGDDSGGRLGPDLAAHRFRHTRSRTE